MTTSTIVRKKYLVGGNGIPHAYTDTIAEAKKAGLAIARRIAWKGKTNYITPVISVKWNIPYRTLSIDKMSGLSYKPTGWKLYVPVRGSGKAADQIIKAIKNNHGVKPFVWKRG